MMMAGMNSSVIQPFRQEVCCDGYHITEAALPDHPDIINKWLVANYLPGRTWSVKTYDPLHDPAYGALFRTFADLEPTDEGIVAFANRYGALHGSGTQDLIRPQEYSFHVFADLVRAWENEVVTLRSMIVLWELLVANDIRALAAMVKRDDPTGFPYFHIPDPYPSFHMGMYSFLMAPKEDCSPDALLQQARYWVRITVNERLSSNVYTYLEQSPEDGRLRLSISPQNLLGAIWLQFAQAIDGNREYRRCQECGTWMEISPDTNRTNRGYCSDACRAKAYRQRKKRARQLSAQGATVEAIAKALDVDLRSVENWVRGVE